jgi:hypothetical protein
MNARRFVLATLLAGGCAPATDLTHVAADGTPAGATAGPGGAVLVDPPPGAAEVPLNLQGVVVRFPGAIDWGPSGLVLCDGGPAVPTSAPAPTDCAGGVAGVCYRADVQAGLPPSVACSVALAPGAVDADGGAVAPGVIGVFQDAAQVDATPPVLGDVTVKVSGPCLEVAFSTDEPATGTVTLQAGDAELDTPAGTGQTSFDVAIPLGALPPSAAATVAVAAVDLAGNVASSAPFAFTTPVAVPPLAITEVLANPAGPEPQQEYVELRNLGDVPASLAGLRLTDSKGGDDLPDQMLGPGAYALVVTSTYDPAEGSDPPPRAGTALVRVDSRLGSDGLSNSGEPVQLLQGDAVVSSYAGWVSVSAGSWNGKAVHRLVQTACDTAAAWNHAPLLPTPGDGPP